MHMCSVSEVSNVHVQNMLFAKQNHCWIVMHECQGPGSGNKLLGKS